MVMMMMMVIEGNRGRYQMSTSDLHTHMNVCTYVCMRACAHTAYTHTYTHACTREQRTFQFRVIQLHSTSTWHPYTHHVSALSFQIQITAKNSNDASRAHGHSSPCSCAQHWLVTPLPVVLLLPIHFIWIHQGEQLLFVRLFRCLPSPLGLLETYPFLKAKLTF